MLFGVKYLRDHGIDHWDLEYVALPHYHSPSRSSSDLWTYHVACEQTGEHCFPSQGPIVGYRFRRPWHVPRLGLLIGNISRMRVIWPCSSQVPRLLWGTTHVRRMTFKIRRSGGTEPKRARQAGRSLVNRVRSLPTPTNYPYRD